MASTSKNPTFNSNSSNVGIKKAMAQFRDYTKQPVDGTNIFVLENDLRTFHINTRVERGVYEGLVIHWELQIPDQYPFMPASGRIADGFYFTRSHHEHVFEEQGLCTDYLSNFAYMQKGASAYGGWTPSGTLIQLMLAMKEFFAEPDMNIPHKVIQDAFQKNKNFKCNKCGGSIKDINMTEKQKSGPEKSSQLEEKIKDEKQESVDGPETPESSQIDKDDLQRRARAERELICPVIMRSPLNDSDNNPVLIGFPITLTHSSVQQQKMPKNASTSDEIRRLRLVNFQIFPELLSFEAYMQSLAIEGVNIDNLNLSRLRSPMGNWYTHLILIYLNRQHYDRAEVYLQTLLSVICFGSQYDHYHPAMFVKVYPAIMNKIIVSLLRCEAHESEILLMAFANLLRTYRHACTRYPEVREINDQHVVEFCRDPNRRHKNWTNDLGELLFKMAALDTNTHSDCTINDENVKTAFMKEFLARQIQWVHKYWSSDERGRDRNENFFGFFNQKNIPNPKRDEFLSHYFEACQVSLKVMLFNLECLSVLMTPDFDDRLDRNYGLLEVDQLKQFREGVIAIKNLKKLSDFFKRANYPIQDASEALKLVKTAYEDAKSRKGSYWLIENKRVEPQQRIQRVQGNNYAKNLQQIFRS